ncbi:MAG TPA: Swt1 family HEPN domain-containing protein [Spirochaetota bacterium]|nr:Swt1 family HEPN domain-containing protein [Spirochaetota bacterium]
MAKTNQERVGEGLDLLVKGLVPFIEREMQASYKGRWKEVADNSFSDMLKAGKKINWNDPQTILVVMWDQWNNVFKIPLGHSERSIVSELRDVRNKWAHKESFSTDDTYRALDSMGRLLSAVSAPEADDIEKRKDELLRLRFDEQRRSESRKKSVVPVDGAPAGNLRPWREIVTPHPDVASGRYQQAEFAADLWQVYCNEGSDEYKDPMEFFRRTYITEGLKQLLVNSIMRMTGEGGDPVVELQTNFGGGKTHSMLALYHLFSGTPLSELPGVDKLISEKKMKAPEKVNRAVLVGTKISPGQPHKKPDGTVIRTLWGEIAWQLGGAEGYGFVKKADETATNPGDALKDLFNKYSPCLVLIDEWVAYARQLHEDATLAGGTFDTQFTFAQALTETIKAAKNSMLVVSIPASESPSPHDGSDRVSDIEVGGERGKQALSRLKNAIGRVEASWRPASQDEGFEIVRRRLFQPIANSELFVFRDLVAKAYVDMYRDQQQEFPSDCKEASYERRIKEAYPIHPELFDRLFNDWSTLDKFQRTRGVLRLMAAVIHSLWERQDSSLLIMPAHVPVDDSRVQFELTRYLEDQWQPVIAKDVDGPHSLPLSIDRETPNLGRYSASRRVARTIYMGSAPTQRAANRGIEERLVKLGCVQPGESVATFGDALRRLTDRATYLYVDSKRYWYATLPTVARLADDRANQLDDHIIHEEIQRRLRIQARTRGDFSKVHACVFCNDIPDEKEARLVILDPTFTHTQRDGESSAMKESKNILDSRGTGPRTYKNTLVFVAADSSRLKDLEHAVRMFLSWKSICEEKEALNLDAFQTRQAETKYNSANDTIEVRIPETFQWLLVPDQPDPMVQVLWEEIKLQGNDPLAVKASKKLKNDAKLMPQFGSINLKHELDRIPLWRDGHVSVKQLTEVFATYLYLPRLLNEGVLLDAIRDGVARIGWESETFAFAEKYDEVRNRYIGLSAGTGVRILSDGNDVVVTPERAKRQMSEDQQAAQAEHGVAAETGSPVATPGDGNTPLTSGTQKSDVDNHVLKRFHGSVKLDPIRAGRDAGKVAEEVIQHLSGIVGATVDVTMEISVNVPAGISENVVRIVSENCNTLNFDTHGFEEE